MTRVAVLAAIVFLLAAAPANAGVFPAPTGIGLAPANDPQLDELARLAEGFWTGKTPETCPQHIAVYLADDLGTDAISRAASGVGGSCEIAFRRDAMQTLNSGIAQLSRRQQVRVLTIKCGFVVHESGHALGLPHSESGVMMDGVGPAPGVCVAWAIRNAGRDPVVAKRKAKRSDIRHAKHRVSGRSVG